MKTLYIVRHAKSSRDYPKVKDIDRPLKERGIHDADLVARRLKKTGRRPELIITSPATRALHTATIFRRILDIPEPAFKLDNTLYDATVDDILEVVYGVGDEVSSVMIFGHNPSFTYIVNDLTSLNLDNLPTSGLVIAEFNTGKWTEIDRQYVTFEFLDYPKKA